MIFPYHSVSSGSNPYNYISEYPVIHVQTALPHYLIGIYAQCISLFNMVIKKCRK